MSKTWILETAGGRIRCIQCQAMAKGTRQQCLRPATRGKNVCKLHGGKSTGPRTPAGRRRCAEARLVHGRETATLRNQRALASARLAVLEWAGHALGLMSGQRTRGPKPCRMADVEPELRYVVKRMLDGWTRP